MLLLFFLSLSFNLFAQNLLMNGGFEDENICTEYQKNCAPEGWISTSLFADYYFDDAPNAFEGQHFVGLVLADSVRPAGRNFLRSRLLCGLRRGAKYALQFYIRSRHDVFDSIGVYFSPTDFLYQKEKLRNTTPQLLLKNEQHFSPSPEWQKASFVYTASGDENYLVLGDFKKGVHNLKSTHDLGKSYYFFIDSISLTPLNPAEHLCMQADSVKEEEYDFNVRHTMLDRLVYVNTKNPPPVMPLPKTILQRIDTLILPDILFTTNSYALSEKGKTLLDAFIEQSKALQIDSLVVEGHTDSRGQAASNQKLSEDRAASVASYLVAALHCNYKTYGRASERPVADNKTAEGRQKNRRVEIYLYVRD